MRPNTLRQPQSTANPSDAELGDLASTFALARAYPPTAHELECFLRCVPPATRGAARRIGRIFGGIAAAATAASAGIVGAVVLLAPTAQPKALGMSAVIEAMRRVELIKTVSDTHQTWESPGQFYAVRSLDGQSAGFWNYIEQWRATYQARRGCVMISSVDPPPISGSMVGATTLDELIRQLESVGNALESRWERRDAMLDGRPVIELTSRVADPTDQARLVIDARDGRLLQRTLRSETVHFEYPDHGPRDIYDLGVPPDVKVVDGRASPQIFELRDRLRASTGRFGGYRAGVVRSGSAPTRYRFTTDGRRIRIDSPAFPEKEELTLEGLKAVARQLALCDGVDPLSHVSIFDGQREVSAGFDASGAITHAELRSRDYALAWYASLEELSGGRPDSFFGLWPDRQDEYLPAAENGWVGYRTRGQANSVSRPYLWERWFDPARGFLPAVSRTCKFPSADWQIDSNWADKYEYPPTVGDHRTAPQAPAEGHELRVIEWGELRPGVWYPAVKVGGPLVQNADGDWTPKGNWDSDAGQAGFVEVIYAEPLERTDESWFQIRPEWAEKARPFPPDR